jgi:hypothetical protein
VKLARSCLLVALLCWCSPIFAQGVAQDGAGTAQDGKDAAESRATSFQAVEGPQKEEVSGGTHLVSAYAFVLVLLIGYVGRLGALQSKTAAEVQRLTRALERAKSE